ncbi:ferredoxin [Thermogladius calderae 1633]|uniref:Ferredoxin n=1 Tax=Thermogladius calderae (strain DSM 22663 / VKM B-2946 / 1633) TaxID=1184251 RepID=I3TEX4_THEC1|nr:ferredoxin [Thermogladius calderae]AFK51312.1 ferredoxin [Thermogladius calderae 1633]
MAKYKVEINPRENCISDMVCVSICPDVFEMSPEDNKSQIVEKYRADKANIAVGIVPEDLKSCVEDAAAACPVQIIHVTKAE